MQNTKIRQDIRPLSEVGNGMASFIKHVRDTKRPLVITQRGKSAAVLIDAQVYEVMQEKLELLSDIQTALNQLEKGDGIDHEDAKALILKRVPV